MHRSFKPLPCRVLRKTFFISVLLLFTNPIHVNFPNLFNIVGLGITCGSSNILLLLIFKIPPFKSYIICGMKTHNHIYGIHVESNVKDGIPDPIEKWLLILLKLISKYTHIFCYLSYVCIWNSFYTKAFFLYILNKVSTKLHSFSNTNNTIFTYKRNFLNRMNRWNDRWIEYQNFCNLLKVVRCDVAIKFLGIKFIKIFV